MVCCVKPDRTDRKCRLNPLVAPITFEKLAEQAATAVAGVVAERGKIFRAAAQTYAQFEVRMAVNPDALEVAGDIERPVEAHARLH